MRRLLLLALLTLPLVAQEPVPAVPSQNPATPATEAAPLPDLNTLMHDVEAHERAATELRKRYIYRVTSVTEETDNNGRVKKTERNVYEHFWQDGAPVERLIEKDGKPLDDKEKQKQEEEVQKAVKSYRERRAKNEDVVTVSRILELGAFTNPRREIYKGRSTILADYMGDPKAKTRNRFEDAFKRLAGTVWIDEATRSMVRGEGHFTEDFKIGGGLLASIHKGLHFVFEQTRINDEVWLPASIQGDGSARIMLFVKLQGRQTATFSDYRKYRTGATILPGVSEVPDKVPEEPASPDPK